MKPELKRLRLAEPFEGAALDVLDQALMDSRIFDLLFASGDTLLKHRPSKQFSCPHFAGINQFALGEFVLIGILDRSQQTRGVRRALEKMDRFHETLILLFRHHDDAAGVLSGDEEWRMIIAHLVHVGREVVAQLTVRNVCHRVPLNVQIFVQIQIRQ